MTPDPHDNTRAEPHGFADLVTIATCACGAEFTGEREAEALALWGEHVTLAEGATMPDNDLLAVLDTLAKRQEGAL